MCKISAERTFCFVNHAELDKLLSPLCKLVLPLIIAIVFPVGTLAADVGCDQIGRFQLVAAHSASETGVVVFRIDTATGKTWMFDTVNFDVATQEYITQQGVEKYIRSKEVQDW